MSELERQRRRYQEARQRLYHPESRPATATRRMEPPADAIDDVMSLIAELAGRVRPSQIFAGAMEGLRVGEEDLVGQNRHVENVRRRACLLWVLVKCCPTRSMEEFCKVLKRDRRTLNHFAKQWPTRPPDTAMVHSILAATRRRLNAQP